MAEIAWEGDLDRDYSLGSNWSGGVVPGAGDTAVFYNVPTTYLLGVNGEVAGWRFNGGRYTLNVADNGVTFSDTGIVTAGGTARILKDGVGNFLTFLGSSSAGSANISGGGISFLDSSSAGRASIGFQSGELLFTDASTAAGSKIEHNGLVRFEGSSTAGNATITSSYGGVTIFAGNSTGGNARLFADTEGSVDFSASRNANGQAKNVAGSIEGPGDFFLGGSELTVGGNNISTTVQGVISDGGNAGATGASLVKVGTATLTLSGHNTYTGVTIVRAGSLLVHGSIANKVVVENSATLGGVGTVNDVLVKAGAALSPGSGAATLSTGSVEIAAGATLRIDLAPMRHDQLTVSGTVDVGGSHLAVAHRAGFDPSETESETFLIIDNDGSDPISGKFEGLSEGSQVIAGSRLYRLSYKGGDGNDVVLVSGGTFIQGTDGIDVITGGQSPTGQRTATDLWDLIQGNDGNDTIDARGGDDIISGGRGKDTLAGAGGSDAFVFDAKVKKGNVDRILDFKAGRDEITLDADIFGKLKLGGLKKSAFVAGKNVDEAHDRSDRIIIDTKSGKAWYDGDGEGGKSAKLFAVMEGDIAGISHKDFVIVA